MHYGELQFPESSTGDELRHQLAARDATSSSHQQSRNRAQARPPFSGGRRSAPRTPRPRAQGETSGATCCGGCLGGGGGEDGDTHLSKSKLAGKTDHESFVKVSDEPERRRAALPRPPDKA